MSEISKLLKESHNPQQRLMAETRGLVGKWEKTGLLEGITSDTEKGGVLKVEETSVFWIVLERII